MISATQLSDTELMDYAEIHIQYEYDMLTWSARVLAFLSANKIEGVIGWVIQNGLLNTFSIHARNLIQFLYPDIKTTQPTDITVEHYLADEFRKIYLSDKLEILKEAKRKADKQVAHLTTDRIQYELSGKEWDFLEIAQVIKNIFSVISEFIPNNKISSIFKNKLSDERLISPPILTREILNEKQIPIGLEVLIKAEVIINPV